MKHYNNGIDSRRAILEGESIASEQREFSDFRYGSHIEKFPTEFKKNIFKSVDKRFLLILFISITLNISTVLILRRVLPEESTFKSINLIQEQYAKLLMNNEIKPSASSGQPVASDYKLDTQLITGLNKWMETFTSDILESIKDTPAVNAVGRNPAPGEMRLPTQEQFGIARQSAAGKRIASREGLEKEMNSVGLLGVISSNTKIIDQDYVQDLLEYASENSSQLTQVLAKLNTIEVPRYVSNEYLRKIRKSGLSEEFAGLKGGRTTMDNEIRQIIENVEPLKPVETTSMKRNLQYEELPSTSTDVGKLPDANIVSKTRLAQDVMKVVQSHTRALQDCYKQELKYDPDISGKIVVRFTIDPDGTVITASVITSTLNSPRMEECILNRIKRWRNFPPCDPAAGEKTYRQSFSFGEKK